TDQGIVYLVYGSAGIASNSTFHLDAGLNGTNGVEISGQVLFDSRTGYAMACPGDVNGDGFTDILITNPSYDAPANKAGRVYLLYGRSGTLAADGTFDLETQMSGNGVTFTGGADQQLGMAVSGIGDFNGDGFSDFAIA